MKVFSSLLSFALFFVSLSCIGTERDIHGTLIQVNVIEEIVIPSDATDISISYSIGKLSAKTLKKNDYNTSSRTPTFPGTPTVGDTITYSYTSGDYRISETWTYVYDSGSGTYSWRLEKRSQEYVGENQEK